MMDAQNGCDEANALRRSLPFVRNHDKIVSLYAKAQGVAIQPRMPSDPLNGPQTTGKGTIAHLLRKMPADRLVEGVPRED